MMHAGMSLLMSAPAVLFQTLLVAAASGYIILGRLPSLSGRSAKSRIKFLLVTAHPDDECMFFGPALTNLLSSGEEVHLLCLSEGDLPGRREELVRSCGVLGIPAKRVYVASSPELKDGMHNAWDAQAVIREILKQLNRIEDDSAEAEAGGGEIYLLTFDQRGVSFHPNHRSIYLGVRSLMERINTGKEGGKECTRAECIRAECTRAKSIRAYSLETISIMSKYILPVGLWQCVARAALLGLSGDYFVERASLRKYLLIRKAMLQHVSQLRWFRLLYIHVSCYMLVNLLRPICADDSPKMSLP